MRGKKKNAGKSQKKTLYQQSEMRRWAEKSFTTATSMPLQQKTEGG
jgi:hypothetical protein